MPTNVLVYDGPGVSNSALQHTLRTLRRLLPRYDVQTVNAKTLALDPWHASTALVVLPGGRDLPYIQSLGEPFSHPSRYFAGPQRADEQLAKYVHSGGSFLGICAGAYFASSRCVFEPGTSMQVVGDRPALKFFPGECVGTVYPGFVYESDAGARLVDLELEEEAAGTKSFKCQYNGGGAFMQADSYHSQGVKIVARYSDDDRALQRDTSNPKKPKFGGQAAAVLCKVDQGKALLYGSHPEFPMSTVAMFLQEAEEQDSAESGETGPKSALVKDAKITSDLQAWEQLRLKVFANHLELLGLQVQSPGSSPDAPATTSSLGESTLPPSITDPPKLTPLFLLSSSSTPSGFLVDCMRRSAARSNAEVETNHLASVREVLTASSSIQPEFTISEANDTFHLIRSDGLFAGSEQDPVNAPVSKLCRAITDSSYEDYIAKSSDAGAVEETEPDLHSVPKYIVQLPAQTSGPDELAAARLLAPHFNPYAYMQALDTARDQIQHYLRRPDLSPDSLLVSIESGPMRWGGAANRLGADIMYGQVVTSTQTMLDKNFKLLRTLPTGFTCIGTHQVSGRGRGKNAWISPLGCFQFSLVLRLPASAASQIAFLQFLGGLAITLALRSGIVVPPTGNEEEDNRLRKAFSEQVGKKVRIKWPNDLYAEVDEDLESSGLGQRQGVFTREGKRYAKLGGILVNSQFADKEFILVVGCGVNVLNRRPTTSVSDLILAANSTASTRGDPILPIISQEQFGGAVLATFERLWTVFEQSGSFQPLIEAYKEVWLHSNQMATLADTDPPTPIRIVGITSDYGFLRAVHATSNLNTASAGAWGPSEKKGDGTWIDLQPDGNSFDMLHNMLRRKD
ncbi:biotin holocarboxylase synthetase [Tilletia horrida]|uniref:Biotin holocarboxylase synthetase n=1 Tax=Tilletia horrida TaxID=155126 RepID=A0AAN6GMD9_9BASI|nr:biotin holocarboxylase synthetase [Tilletia horrida]KAK0547437.1 biotin holocarboxylase synthetase [Tilletia horrida]KAK0561895.1 biotin holocarboxylase synthetase [Tilletia horrida]